jgi:hypothetical protein
MRTSTPKNTHNEEIDLGVLFNSIGRGISKLVTAIGTVILFVLNTALSIVVFVRKRVLYFAIACSIGVIAGFIVEKNTPLKYVATATLEPHFDSARQLYSNVDYLNDLANQKDSIQLASFFGISQSEAAAISFVGIKPFITEIALLQEYNAFFEKLDSIVASEITFSDFVKQIDDYDRKVHLLTVESSKQDLFGALLNPIVNSVSEITYFKDQQTTQLGNLQLSDSTTQVSIVQTDSLLSLFEEVKLVEATKEFSNGTNLYMAEKAEDNAEILLLNRKITLTERLEQIRTAKLKAKNVVDIIAAFPENGYLDTSFWRNKKILGLLAGFALLSFYYLILSFEQFIASKNEA